MIVNESPKGAILQRDKETYAIVPRIPGGLARLENFKEIVNVVEKYKIPVIKITSGHRLALVGMKGELVNEIWKDLKMDVGKATELCLHYVQACPGNIVCKYGIQDSLGLGIEIEEFFLGMELPAKVKIGVSGCPFCCGESFVRDIGMLGKKNGWTAIFGGNSARRPRIGDIIAEDISKEEVIGLTKRCLKYYAANGKKRNEQLDLLNVLELMSLKKQYYDIYDRDTASPEMREMQKVKIQALTLNLIPPKTSITSSTIDRPFQR